MEEGNEDMKKMLWERMVRNNEHHDIFMQLCYKGNMDGVKWCLDNVSNENENLEVESPNHENSDIDSNSGNTETLNKTKNFFGIPGKAMRLSESTSANATITQSNTKNATTKNLEKTDLENSTKVNQVENMSELEKICLLASKITAKLVIET